MRDWRRVHRTFSSRWLYGSRDRPTIQDYCDCGNFPGDLADRTALLGRANNASIVDRRAVDCGADHYGSKEPDGGYQSQNPTHSPWLGYGAREFCGLGGHAVWGRNCPVEITHVGAHPGD